MATMAVPNIQLEDYPAFQRLGSDWPDTFDGWEMETLSWKALHELSIGNTIMIVDIDALAFELWCKKQGLSGTKDSAKRYAEHVAFG